MKLDTRQTLPALDRKIVLVLAIVCAMTVANLYSLQPLLADAVLYLQTGPEIGVVATKTFLTSTTVLYLLGLYLGELGKQMTQAQIHEILEALERVPDQVQQILNRAASLDDIIAPLSKRTSRCSSMIFIGRGVGYPTALEGALKLKEISYLHAEGFPAGEEKVVSNMQEVRARDAHIIAVATQGDEAIGQHADDILYVPATLEVLSPLLASVPLQLFAYHAAVARGCNVDQPRNLAKSVTVE